MKKLIAVGFVLFSVLILMGCQSTKTVNAEEKRLIVDSVKELATIEYKLYSFELNYDEYLKAISPIVTESYVETMNEQIRFGYDDVIYTGKELTGISTEEWEKHKEEMLLRIKSMALDEHVITVHFSAIYEGEEDNQVYVYTTETQGKDENYLFKRNKKYTLNWIDDQWQVTAVVEDSFTFGSEFTAKEMEKGLAKMNYQTHNGENVKYSEGSLQFQGFAQ